MRGAMRGLARVVVVGATGAGKSVLARAPGRAGSAPSSWSSTRSSGMPDWTPAAPDDFRARVRARDRGTPLGRGRQLRQRARSPVAARGHDRLARLLVPARPAPPDRPHGAPRGHRRGPLERQPRAPSGSTAGSGRRSRCSTGWSRPTGPTGASCPRCSPSPPTPISASRGCGGPARRRRGSPASRRSDLTTEALRRKMRGRRDRTPCISGSSWRSGAAASAKAPRCARRSSWRTRRRPAASTASGSARSTSTATARSSPPPSRSPASSRPAPGASAWASRCRCSRSATRCASPRKRPPWTS